MKYVSSKMKYLHNSLLLSWTLKGNQKKFNVEETQSGSCGYMRYFVFAQAASLFENMTFPARDENRMCSHLLHKRCDEPVFCRCEIILRPFSGFALPMQGRIVYKILRFPS